MKKIITILFLIVFFVLIMPTISYAETTKNLNYTTVDGISFTDNDIKLLAQLVYAEARGESYAGQLAVANNVLNRCLDTYYPDSIAANIYKSGQYADINGEYNKSTYNAAYDVLVNGIRVLPYWALNFQVGDEDYCKYIRMGNHTFNYVIRSNNFWRIWCDSVENPQYFINKLSNDQIKIALKSMPNYYNFNWKTKTVGYNNVKDLESALNIEIQNKSVEIENLNNKVSDFIVKLDMQQTISEKLRMESENFKAMLPYFIVLLITIVIYFLRNKKDFLKLT